MTTALKYVLAITGIILIIGFILPQEYALERKISINASPADIHVFVGDLEKWPAWTPWQKTDPTIKTTMGEKHTGKGASQSWHGESGSGELTFTHSSPEKGISYDMIFDGEFPASSDMVYQVDGPTTTVIWKMNGENTWPVVGGYMSLMMDSMVGPMFDDGLSNLKKVVESKN